jgi:hypothetical protein
MQEDWCRSSDTDSSGWLQLEQCDRWDQQWRLAGSAPEFGIFLHTWFPGSSIVGIGLLNVLPGTDAFFVHGTDQYENVGVVLKYQGALECLYQVVAVFFVEVRFGQVSQSFS